MIKTIKLTPNIDGKIGVQHDYLTVICEEIANSGTKTFNFDFVEVQFLHTTFILGLAVLIDEVESQGGTVKFVNCNSKISEYFSAICFPKGLRPDQFDDWPDILERSGGKTYLPIVNFSNSQAQFETSLRNNIISQFGLLLSQRLNFGTKVHTAISYFISEFTDNIVEHSGEERGWLFYQLYPQLEYVEISIMDSGKTILGSYTDNNVEEVKSDKEAINCALNGISTKGGVERGFGLRTSSDLICNGLLGNTFLTSGEAMFLSSKQKDRIILGCKRWKGTILTVRLPFSIDSNLDYQKYIS